MAITKAAPGLLAVYEGGRLIWGEGKGDLEELVRRLAFIALEKYPRDLGRLRGFIVIIGEYGYVSYGDRLIIVKPDVVDWNHVISMVIGYE